MKKDKIRFKPVKGTVPKSSTTTGSTFESAIKKVNAAKKKKKTWQRSAT